MGNAWAATRLIFSRISRVGHMIAMSAVLNIERIASAVHLQYGTFFFMSFM